MNLRGIVIVDEVKVKFSTKTLLFYTEVTMVTMAPLAYKIGCQCVRHFQE